MSDSAHQTLVPFQSFEAADGWLVVACPKESLWRALCDALGKPELADDERFADLAARDRNRDVLIPLLKEAFARRPVAEWVELLSRRRIPCAPVNDLAAALADPQAEAREAVVEYAHPTLGAVRTVDNALRLEGDRQAPERAPFFGEHSVQILGEVCGYSREHIQELASLGVLGRAEAREEHP
jgi:crotonobetainyl-CoA:carnitine CoA-transferase CaiB-like acyl-CoA transferase